MNIIGQAHKFWKWLKHRCSPSDNYSYAKYFKGASPGVTPPAKGITMKDYRELMERTKGMEIPKIKVKSIKIVYDNPPS